MCVCSTSRALWTRPGWGGIRLYQHDHLVFHRVCVQPGRMGRGYTQWQPLCHLRQVRHCTRYTHQCTPGSVVFILANEDTPDVSSVWICRKKALLFNNIVALVAAVLMVFSPWPSPLRWSCWADFSMDIMLVCVCFVLCVCTLLWECRGSLWY